MYDRHGDTRHMWSSINLTMTTKAYAVKTAAPYHPATCNFLMCQTADLGTSSNSRRGNPYNYRHRSSSAHPTLTQAYRFIKQQPSSRQSLEQSVSPSYSSRPIGSVLFDTKVSSDSWSSSKRSSIKSIVKSDSKSSMSTATDDAPKRVSFDYIEVKEHPRILGDNPSAKKGPALSIGWFQQHAKGCRIHRYSVDEYERLRTPYRTDYAQPLTPAARSRLLMQEAGVTPMEMFVARKEASLIRKSRREHSAVAAQYDDTALVVESCVRTVKRLLTGSVSEWELRELMQQAERAKLCQ